MNTSTNVHLSTHSGGITMEAAHYGCTIHLRLTAETDLRQDGLSDTHETTVFVTPEQLRDCRAELLKAVSQISGILDEIEAKCAMEGA